MQEFFWTCKVEIFFVFSTLSIYFFGAESVGIYFFIKNFVYIYMTQ